MVCTSRLFLNIYRSSKLKPIIYRFAVFFSFTSPESFLILYILFMYYIYLKYLNDAFSMTYVGIYWKSYVLNIYKSEKNYK